MADTGPTLPLDDEPAFTIDDFKHLDHFDEVPICDTRLTLTGPSGEAYELLCELDDDHTEHQATVRWCSDAHNNQVDVPAADACRVVMELDPGAFERCVVTGKHRIHVSEHGYYRWNDAGTLVPTPHFAHPDFERLYAADPRGQFEWRSKP